MVYLLKIAIFHGYVSHNQMVNPDGKSHEILISFPWNPPANSRFPGDGWLAAGLSTLHGWQPLRGIIGDHRTPEAFAFLGPRCFPVNGSENPWENHQKPIGKPIGKMEDFTKKNGDFMGISWDIPFGTINYPVDGCEILHQLGTIGNYERLQINVNHGTKTG